MKKSNIFVIVCAGMIGVGILFSGVGYLMGGRVWGIGLGATGIHVNSPNLMYEGENAISYLEETKDLGKFDSMDIAMEYGDVLIIPSDHYGIEYCVDSRYSDFAPEVVDGCLVAKEKNMMQLRDEWVFWGIGNGGMMLGSQKDEYIKIYVPEGAAFETVKASADFGEVECEGIKADKLDLEADFGNMTLNDIQGNDTTLLAESGKLKLTGFTGETLTIENQFGDVVLENVDSGSFVAITTESGKCDADTMQTGALTVVQEFGDVVLKNVVVSGESEIKSESGAITLEKYETGNLFLKSDFGNVDGEEVAAATGTLTLESGNCDIGWTKIETLTVESDFGDVKLTLPELTENYNLELWTEFGDITVDRVDEGSHYHASVVGTDSISVGCESGSIRIKGASR